MPMVEAHLTRRHCSVNALLPIGGGLSINVEGLDCVVEVKNSVFTGCTLGPSDSQATVSRHVFLSCVEATFLTQASFTGIDYTTEKSAYWARENTQERNAQEQALCFFLCTDNGMC